ncbi:MAG TPA: enolase C-terminal domain-like protein [Gaiellaceae bacterium]|nr:enolase C-terminal domain-like protein [Gaiellaceae bacterium]
MKIVGVDVYGYDLTYRHGSYVMSGGRSVDVLPSTIVRVRTDEGIEGFGETCPLGTTYLPAFGAGARAALRELAPALVGVDPCNLAAVADAMDQALRGHDYAKSALDTACWDVLGQATGLPVAMLLGGVRQESFPLYVAIPLGSVEATVEHVRNEVAAGIHRFQLKLGADPREDAERAAAVVKATGDEELVIADANGGWRLQDAVVAARLLDGLPRTFLEQPCASLEECLYVRRLTTLPMVLDESITDTRSLLRAWTADGMEAINLKVSKVGGLTKARRIRDLADELGLRVTIEDTWGGDVTTAAVSHLAASTSAEALLTVSFMNDWTNEHVAGYEPRSENGVGRAPTGPGLGIAVDVEALGEPLFSTP